MRLQVLYEAEGKEFVQSIREQLKDFRVSFHKILMNGDWAAPGSSFDDVITADTRIVAVITGDAYGSPWFAYFAGLCRGREQTLVAYSGKKTAVPKIYEKTVIPLAGKKELEKRFSGYLEEWIAGEKTETAKRELLDMGIPFSAASLSDCVRTKKSAAVNLFLRAGFSANVRDGVGVPLLCLAARTGDKDLVKILLKAGAGVNTCSADRGGSALIDCAMGKYRDIAELLLKAGADVNTKSKDGQSALIISVGMSDEKLVEMFLKAGAKVDEPDALGASARKYAALFNKPKIVELFKKYAGK
ncbi:MAG: ankyrin repeat domain-containing protein [Treponema sp.]|jgi:hypothetical protein|nr:ankyrin repeat domain-containing protein [Treponema sp.]